MNPRKIYVASNWTNAIQPIVVSRLRQLGHEVYDFRNPKKGNTGFSWDQIDPDWENWDVQTYLIALETDIAREGFELDFNAMKWADTFVLVMPGGFSAGMELGWSVGQNKPSALLALDESMRPDLMVKMLDNEDGRGPHVYTELIYLESWLEDLN